MSEEKEHGDDSTSDTERADTGSSQSPTQREDEEALERQIKKLNRQLDKSDPRRARPM
jgi:uncharacterized FlaG/YvyC family protein